MPVISVILPFYNTERTLKYSVKSILNQNFTDFELLLINNNYFSYSYVNKMESLGFKDEDIKARLENAGYKEDFLNGFFKAK